MIILFDVDGTLVSTGGAGRRAYEAAFTAEFGDDHGLLEFSFSGLTDPLIVRHGLEMAGHDVDEKRLRKLFERYLDHLPRKLETATDYVVHPGARDLVAELTNHDARAVGLGTGNIEAGARLKLEPAGLNDYFSFGGFGSDAEARADILRAGVVRGARLLGVAPEETRIVIIGDTPRDVRAARAIDADCLAVNTGSTDESVLHDADPDHFVEDLLDPSAREYLGAR